MINSGGILIWILSASLSSLSVDEYWSVTHLALLVLSIVCGRGGGVGYPGPSSQYNLFFGGEKQMEIKQYVLRIS